MRLLKVPNDSPRRAVLVRPHVPLHHLIPLLNLSRGVVVALPLGPEAELEVGQLVGAGVVAPGHVVVLELVDGSGAEVEVVELFGAVGHVVGDGHLGRKGEEKGRGEEERETFGLTMEETK